MLSKFEHFTSFSSFELLCNSIKPFFLVYPIGSSNDKHLKKLANQCVASNSVHGVVFTIDKENHDYDQLFYLKTIIEKIMINGKNVGLWGVPNCVPRKILGGYIYMKFRYWEIAEPTVNLRSNKKRYLIEACENCFDNSNCIGLGRRNSNNYKPAAKTRAPMTALNIEQGRANFDCSSLEKNHQAFMKHCRSIESACTYRRVYYTTNIDYHSKHSYPNRFIYQCDYLAPEEYNLEFSFLTNQAINKHWPSLFESISSIDRTKQIAYSLAEKHGEIRESFYLFVTEQYGFDLLQEIGIAYDLPKTPDMRFMGAGIDVVRGDVECYKLYFRAPKNFVINYFEHDINGLSQNSHYVVLRLDSNSTLISFKIELLFSYKDLPVLEPLLPNYKNLREKLDPTGLYNVAVEFENDCISKVNIYHQQMLHTHS